MRVELTLEYIFSTFMSHVNTLQPIRHYLCTCSKVEQTISFVVKSRRLKKIGLLLAQKAGRFFQFLQ